MWSKNINERGGEGERGRERAKWKGKEGGEGAGAGESPGYHSLFPPLTFRKWNLRLITHYEGYKKKKRSSGEENDDC